MSPSLVLEIGPGGRARFRRAGRVVAAGQWRCTSDALQLDGFSILSAEEEVADLVIDALETAALAAGVARLVVVSPDAEVRRYCRALSFRPMRQGRRLAFLRSFPGCRKSGKS